jgi:serine/threonine protein kinase
LGWSVTVALDVLAGLHHLHSATSREGKPLELVHRDLKPSNLLVTRDGTAKIIDFGIAHLEGTDRTQTRTGLMRGSLPYCSPEMAQQEPLDARSDLFSFGLVLYELVTGHRVFSQKSEAAILSAVLWSPVLPIRQRLPEASAELESLICDLLEKDRAKRPASAQQTRERLESVFPVEERYDRPRVAAWLQSATARRVVGTHTSSASIVADLPEALENPPATRGRRGWLYFGISAAVLAAVLGMTAPLWMGKPAEVTKVETLPAPLPEIVSEAPKPIEPSEPSPPPPKPTPAVVRSAPIPKEGGWLTVGVPSGWAHIQIDGRDMGATPLFRRELSAGRHTVTATRKDGVRKVQTVVIEPRKEKKLSIRWDDR